MRKEGRSNSRNAWRNWKPFLPIETFVYALFKECAVYVTFSIPRPWFRICVWCARACRVIYVDSYVGLELCFPEIHVLRSLCQAQVAEVEQQMRKHREELTQVGCKHLFRGQQPLTNEIFWCCFSRVSLTCNAIWSQPHKNTRR